MDPGGSQQAGPAPHDPAPSEYELLEAVKSGDQEALTGLLARENADINAGAEDGVAALNLAVLDGDTAAAVLLLQNGADVNLETWGGETPLSMAVTNGDTAMTLLLLDHNADPNHRDLESVAPLHIAATRGDFEVVRLLIQYGAVVGVQARDGKEALFLAIENVPVPGPVVGLLLENGADPDAFYSVHGTDAPTALHLACEKGDVETARALLEADAKVDIRDPQGATPLFRAVQLGRIEVVRLLLQRGASTQILSENGQSVFDIAQGNDRLIEILQSDKVFQGPQIGNPDEAEPQVEPSVLRMPFRIPTRNMIVACKGFDVTITDFFTKTDAEQKRHEQILLKTESVHDVLYEQGPSAIMGPARESQMDGGKPDFTWFHIPSNNMEWAEHLIRRLAIERENTSAEAYAVAVDELNLTLSRSAGHQNGRRVARMRPHCRPVPGSSSLDWSEGADNMVAFVPFLHLETYAAYRKMAHAVDKARAPLLRIPGDEAKPIPQRWSRRPYVREDTILSETGSSPVSSVTVRNGSAGWFGSATRSLRIKLANEWRKMWRKKSATSEDSDLEGRPSEEEMSGSGMTTSGDLPSRASGSSVLASMGGGSRVSGSRGSGTGVRGAHKGGTLPGGIGVPQNDRVDDPPVDNDVPPRAQVPRRSTDRQSGAHRSARSTATSSMRVTDTDIANTDKNLHEHLIQGYLMARPSQEPSLQLRQTLDQYLYSHLESTSQRDEDQVVYRFTKGEPIPKMFMVDQLWMWILGNDTIVTCFPLQWDAWLLREGERSTRPRFLQPVPPGLGMPFPSLFPTQVRRVAKPVPGKPMVAKRVTIWDPKGKAKPPKPPHRRPQRQETVEKRPVLKPEDPMSISQNIFFYLSRGSSREPIGSVYKLASLITSHCVDVFDPNQIPEDFQFFEFFEQSINDVSDKVASRLAVFREGLQDHEIEGIEEEIELAIEIEDIRDELNILKTVLNDQESLIGDMDQALRNLSGGRVTPVHTKTRHHLMAWVLQMEKTAGKTHSALHRLIDLKMNQASLTEAFFARQSALDTASQGRTVVVFTLVTIVFLPMSFMAAIFAINTNGFPLDSDERIPFDYLMKYLVSIGLALSIPFIYVAFNVDTIAKWLRSLRPKFDRLIGKRARQAALAIPALLVIYLPLLTSSLSPGIKAAVSIFIALMVLGTVCVQLVLAQIGSPLHRHHKDKDSDS